MDSPWLFWLWVSSWFFLIALDGLAMTLSFLGCRFGLCLSGWADLSRLDGAAGWQRDWLVLRIFFLFRLAFFFLLPASDGLLGRMVLPPWCWPLVSLLAAMAGPAAGLALRTGC